MLVGACILGCRSLITCEVQNRKTQEGLVPSHIRKQSHSIPQRKGLACFSRAIGCNLVQQFDIWNVVETENCMRRASRITIWVRYGSKNGYGSLRGDPDVWNEELSSRVLFRTSSKGSCPGPLQKVVAITEVWIMGMDRGYGSYPLKWYGSWVWIMGMDRMWVRGMDRAFTCWSAAICHISLLSHRSATWLLSSSTVLQYTGAICQKIYGSLTISRISHGPETKVQFSSIFLNFP